MGAPGALGGGGGMSGALQQAAAQRPAIPCTGRACCTHCAAVPRQAGAHAAPPHRPRKALVGAARAVPAAPGQTVQQVIGQLQQAMQTDYKTAVDGFVQRVQVRRRRRRCAQRQRRPACWAAWPGCPLPHLLPHTACPPLSLAQPAWQPGRCHHVLSHCRLPPPSALCTQAFQGPSDDAGTDGVEATENAYGEGVVPPGGRLADRILQLGQIITQETQPLLGGEDGGWGAGWGACRTCLPACLLFLAAPGCLAAAGVPTRLPAWVVGWSGLADPCGKARQLMPRCMGTRAGWGCCRACGEFEFNPGGAPINAAWVGPTFTLTQTTGESPSLTPRVSHPHSDQG